MRKKPGIKLEAARIRDGKYASTHHQGNNGAFLVKGPRRAWLLIIASDSAGWDHVSVRVHKQNRCPRWDEMAFVKTLFWDDEEEVMQLHPRQSQYVNNHPYVLHLWRPQNREIPLPPFTMVGIPTEHDARRPTE
ncbi:MAG: hypothetical protein KC418_08780 [Anaerolineales bacterium]|nr:hypothetical protein [Anaerolineales bacterium]